MKIVEWTDGKGWKHRATIRDGDDESLARSGSGISQDPPDIERLDWDKIKRDLHNRLLTRSILTYQDVQREQNGLASAVVSAIVPKLLQLYKNGG